MAGSIKDLVKEAEQRIEAQHGSNLRNGIKRQSSDSHTLQYSIGDGAILILSSDMNCLHVVVYTVGKDGKEKEFYSSPYIADYSKAKELLDFIEKCFLDTSYYDYIEELESFADAFEKVIPGRK